MLTTRRQVPGSDERLARERLVALRSESDRGRTDGAYRPGPPGGGPARAAGTGPLETTAPLPVLGPGSAGEPPYWRRWIPAPLRGARLDPGRRGAAALLVVVCAAALVAAAGVWRDRPVAEPAPPLKVVSEPVEAPRPANPAVSAAASSVPGAALVVSVAGKVRRPGLVRVPEGARVADAIATAGGPLPRVDLTMLNLARRVADGEQILVGLPVPADGQPGGSAAAAPSAGPLGGPGGPGGPGGRIDLNRATVEQLDSLPGVGPVTARRILEWRAGHGRFTAVEQLREVEGIGERRFGQLRDLVTV